MRHESSFLNDIASTCQKMEAIAASTAEAEFTLKVCLTFYRHNLTRSAASKASDARVSHAPN